MAARITRIRYGDGVNDVIDFEDPDSGFKIVVDGYRPTVAKRKRGALGGERVTRVVDTMLLTVSGASAGAANDRVDLLNAVIDQAQAWRGGAAVHVVTIEYRVEGSALANPLQAAITGQPPGGDVVQLPFNYDSATSETVIGSFDDPLVFSFERWGEWLGAEESNTSTTVDNGDLMSLALTAVTVDSPTVIRLGEILDGANETWGGFLIVAEDDDNIIVTNAEVLTGTNYASVADGTNLARNTNILRYTPPDTDVHASPSTPINTINDETRLVSIFANMRNTSSTEDFLVWVNVQRFLETENLAGPVVVPAGAANPQWYFMGTIVLGSAPININMRVQATGIASSPLLEIDTIVTVNMSSGASVIGLDEGDLFIWGNDESEIVFDHQLLSKPVAGTRLESLVTAGQIANVGYQGVPAFFTNAADLRALYLSTGGNDARHWRRSNGAGTVAQHYVTATRRPAYLVPR